MPPPYYPVDPAFTGEVDIPGAEVRYYDIAGRSDIDLLGEIRRLGPKVHDGPRGAATSASVGWEALGDGKICPKVTVSAVVTVVFPRWTPPADAPSHSVGNWQRFVYALAVHERGHVELIREFVAAMPEQLAGDCPGVDVRGHAALAAIDEAGKRYDEATESGAKQGALLFAPRNL